MFDSDRTMGIVAEVVDIIERKVKANNIVRAKSGNKIVIVSLTELGLERCDGDVATWSMVGSCPIARSSTAAVTVTHLCSTSSLLNLVC